MFTRFPVMLNRTGRIAEWTCAFAVVLLLVQSAFWSERVPWQLKAMVGMVAVVAGTRPWAGLMVVAGLVPFGHLLVTRVWSAYPFALAEAMVLAFLAGYLLNQRRAAWRSTVPTDNLVAAARLLLLVVLASCAVQVAELQVWHDYPLRYGGAFLDFLATEYLTTIPDPRPWVDGRNFVSTAALLLEGAALLLCTRTLCIQRPTLAHRLTDVIIAAGAVIAVLSFYQPLASVVTGEQPLGTLFAERRSSPAILSINTAGSYLLLVAFIAIGTAAASRTHFLPRLVAAAVCVTAMWLTRTLAAIVAGLATLVAAAIWLVSTQRFGITPSRAALIATLTSIVVGVVVVFFDPLHMLGTGVNQSLNYRVLFTQTALRMLMSRPLLGVGPDRYVVNSPSFSPPELLATYPRSETHNNFLWVATELGVVGFAIFVWLVGGALARGWSQIRPRRIDYRVFGTVVGSIAFITTWLSWQPLSVPQVAYTFWIILGLLAGHGTAETGHASLLSRRHLLRRIGVAGIVVLVAGSVPFRISRQLSEIDLSRVRYGFYNSSTADGRDFRWAGPRARFFMRPSVKAINIPLAAKLPDMLNGADVEILVNGRLEHRVELRDKEWHDVRVSAPASAEPFWQVDLNIMPIKVRADLEDARRRVGIAEISVER